MILYIPVMYFVFKYSRTHEGDDITLDICARLTPRVHVFPPLAHDYVSCATQDDRLLFPLDSESIIDELTDAMDTVAVTAISIVARHHLQLPT
jgi:hypothetical protein